VNVFSGTGLPALSRTNGREMVVVESYVASLRLIIDLTSTKLKMQGNIRNNHILEQYCRLGFQLEK